MMTVRLRVKHANVQVGRGAGSAVRTGRRSIAPPFQPLFRAQPNSKAQFRFEAYNRLNHTQFGGLDTSIKFR
ncbi:MAG: hypothetical protein DMF60_18955 [Acidobacteria bacterium]|nr:MAG: hypothetical protein DMF60_18955 [Acidobacteriota bacterium]